MKKLFLLTVFLLAVSVLPTFAAGTGETLIIDLGKGVKLEMVKIHAGTFQMGSPDSDDEGIFNEYPQHKVTISKDFYIGKYEVTQGQWKAVMNGTNPSRNKTADNYPVEMVAWNDLFKKGGFFKKINQLKPQGYSGFRLPTEAEWEYSCRANTTTAYYWGSSINEDYLWYKDNSGSTHPVGQKKPNAFGLYDMSGNVFEWCSNIFEMYDDQAVTDPFGPAQGSCRILRGGCCCNFASGCRSAFRGHYDPTLPGGTFGFRIVLSPGKK
jgi:formylglycine-generating enzyme required for sulfatase activity